MLIAILSDIHGNLEALQAVIKHMATRRPEKVICLGDLVGYGPDPEAVLQLYRKHGFLAILGNHEAALHSPDMRNSLNFQARENSCRTEELLSREHLALCRTLPRNLVIEEALFVHGFPPDSVQQYLTLATDKKLIDFFNDCQYKLYFVGHSHQLGQVSWDGRQPLRRKLTEGHYNLETTMTHIINAGSVGQPRDGNKCAKYLLWDSAAASLEVVFVPYDYRTTARKINDRGFPLSFGLRLGSP